MAADLTELALLCGAFAKMFGKQLNGFAWLCSFQSLCKVCSHFRTARVLNCALISVPSLSFFVLSAVKFFAMQSVPWPCRDRFAWGVLEDLLPANAEGRSQSFVDSGAEGMPVTAAMKSDEYSARLQGNCWKLCKICLFRTSLSQSARSG